MNLRRVRVMVNTVEENLLFAICCVRNRYRSVLYGVTAIYLTIYNIKWSFGYAYSNQRYSHRPRETTVQSLLTEIMKIITYVNLRPR